MPPNPFSGEEGLVYSLSFIRIKMPSIPDTIYTHHPKSEMVQFLSDLGYICGLWLGLSVLSLRTWAKNITKTIKSKFSSTSEVESLPIVNRQCSIVHHQSVNRPSNNLFMVQQRWQNLMVRK